MSEQSPAADPRTDSRGPAAPDAETGTAELLIEEISIDGMCGVY
jgi:mycofactocin precursor